MGDSSRSVSAERKSVGLGAGLEKLDLELSLTDRAGLPDELVEPLLGHGAVALLVDVEAAAGAGGFSVDQHAKPDRGALCGRPHDQVQITRAKPVGDPPARLMRDDRLPLHRPIAGERPAIEVETLRRGVRSPRIARCNAAGGEIRRALVAE